MESLIIVQSRISILISLDNNRADKVRAQDTVDQIDHNHTLRIPELRTINLILHEMRQDPCNNASKCAHQEGHVGGLDETTDYGYLDHTGQDAHVYLVECYYPADDAGDCDTAYYATRKCEVNVKEGVGFVLICVGVKQEIEKSKYKASTQQSQKPRQLIGILSPLITKHRVEPIVQNQQGKSETSPKHQNPTSLEIIHNIRSNSRSPSFVVNIEIQVVVKVKPNIEHKCSDKSINHSNSTDNATQSHQQRYRTIRRYSHEAKCNILDIFGSSITDKFESICRIDAIVRVESVNKHIVPKLLYKWPQLRIDRTHNECNNQHLLDPKPEVHQQQAEPQHGQCISQYILQPSSQNNSIVTGVETIHEEDHNFEDYYQQETGFGVMG